MGTYTLRPREVETRWHVLDADGETLGRLATRAAHLLRGKYRPTFTPHLDNGDFVIVVNAAKIRTTGRKAGQKLYRRHSGYPGGLKETLMSDMLQKHPDRVVQQAIKGMMPHNRLSRALLNHLKVYSGPDHPHQAQVNAGKGKKKEESA